jgi:hypothetical protein
VGKFGRLHFQFARDNWSEEVYLEGQAPAPPGSNQNVASWVRVSDGYFDSIGTKIVKGRPITELDTAATRNVAVVNQTFANKFFKNEDPIGKHFGDLDPEVRGKLRDRRGYRGYAIQIADQKDSANLFPGGSSEGRI